MGGRCYVILRRHHDIPIRRHRDVPLSYLGDVPTRRRWVFHLGHICDVQRDVITTSQRRLIAWWGGVCVPDSLKKTNSTKNSLIL